MTTTRWKAATDDQVDNWQHEVEEWERLGAYRFGAIETPTVAQVYGGKIAQLIARVRELAATKVTS